MGLNTLTNKVDGNTIFASDINELQSALNGTFVGRNTSGAASASQSLGSAALPWATIYGNSLIINGSSVDTSQVSAPPFRVVSGATRSTSNQPAFLDPAGSSGGASLDVLATTTDLVLQINGSSVTVTSDISVTGLTTAPSSNNTCAVNDSDAGGSLATRNWGEEFHYTPNDPHKTAITIDAIGSEISAKDGELAAFYNQTSGEYFLARIDSSNNQLVNCYRGFFYDDSLNPINRDAMNDNEILQLMSLGWLFLDSDGSTVDVTYNEPVYSVTQPSSPATGDYWYDLGNSLMRRYDGASFQTVNRVYIGMAVIDTADCVAVRCADFDARFKSDAAIKLEKLSTEQFRASRLFTSVNVYGNEILFQNSTPIWNITTDLANSADMYTATEQSSRQYYFYLTDEGEPVISDIAPYVRYDLKGFYHPHNPWKCLASGYNDSGSDLSFPVSFELTDGGSINTGWSEPEANVITGSVTDPSKANTPVIDAVSFRRAGDLMFIKATYSHTSNTGAAGGSGDYFFWVAGRFKIDTSRQPVSTTRYDSVCGPAQARGSTNYNSGSVGYVSAYDTDKFFMITSNETRVLDTVGTSGIDLNLANPSINISYSVDGLAIEGWH